MHPLRHAPLSRLLAIMRILVALAAPLGIAAQTPEPVNHAATASPLVRSSFDYLVTQARLIADTALRASTLSALTSTDACVRHRAGMTAGVRAEVVAALRHDSLLAPLDAVAADGGIFPALRDDGSACPRLRQSFRVSAGGKGGHHDYPGGLSVHEAYNLRGALQLATLNRTMYHEPPLRLDLIRAAVLWHDWAKAMTLTWGEDGALTPEIEIAGTGAHHILGLAEAMARQLPTLEILAQASSHAAPGLRDNPAIVRWIRAAAIIARCDPVARGYLVRSPAGELLVAPVAMATRDASAMAGAIPFTAFPEAAIVNVSDDNLYSIAATAQVETVLAQLAPEFGYTPAQGAPYRNDYRNPVLSYVGADRLAILFRDGGLVAVSRELERLRQSGVFGRRP